MTSFSRWFVPVLVLILVGLHVSCGGGASRPAGIEWIDLTYQQFEDNPTRKWLALPSGSSDIDIFLFAGFDTNYRFAHTRLALGRDDFLALGDTMAKSNPHPPEDQVYSTNNVPFSLARMILVFPHTEKHRPKWWTDESMQAYHQNRLLAWDDGSYGYGYWLFYDNESETLGVFQWGEQHLLLPRLRAGIERGETIIYGNSQSSP